MKKNYTRPVVEVSIFDFADVVMTSGMSVANGKEEAINSFKSSVATEKPGAIVVQW